MLKFEKSIEKVWIVKFDIVDLTYRSKGTKFLKCGLPMECWKYVVHQLYMTDVQPFGTQLESTS